MYPRTAWSVDTCVPFDWFHSALGFACGFGPVASGNHRALASVTHCRMNPIYSWRWVESEVARITESWYSCASLPLPGGPTYTPSEQQVREQAYDRAMHDVESDLRSARSTKVDRFAMQERMLATFGRFAATVLDLEKGAIRLITDGFLPAGSEFARCSRRFDAGLSMAEIVQACRNAWTVYGLQPLLSQPAEITPSIVGYSLLYPYTDNYLDRADASAAAKQRFCARFRQRLRGECLPPRDVHESAIWTLVAMIEGQYPRMNFPQVFNSLLAIHQAQEESVAQLRADHRLSEPEILNISFAKGGTCACRCVPCQRLPQWPREPDCFRLGSAAPVGDDLQDIREDLRRGSATLFTPAVAQRIPLDSLVAQVLNFSESVAGDLNTFPGGTATLKDLLRMSWRSLIIAAVANVPDFFSSAFLRDLEHPPRFVSVFFGRGTASWRPAEAYTPQFSVP